MKRLIQVGLSFGMLLGTSAVFCFASDLAVLRNGFSIRHERRQVLGGVTRLFVSADGSSFVDVPTAEIEHFEAALADPKPAATQNPAEARSAHLNVANLNQTDLSEVITSASHRYRLDPDLVNSVIRAESGFNVRAVSRKGAQGLMQLMPRTSSQLGVGNAFDAQANVEGGTRYLRELLERYNFDLVKALAAYNAGPRRVEQFGGVPPYYETRAYVARIVRDFNRKKLAQKSVATQPVTPHKSAPKASPVGSASRAAMKQQTPNSSARTKPSSSQPRNE
jgi:soluble lytic murein transglycosylase-like protein